MNTDAEASPMLASINAEIDVWLTDDSEIVWKDEKLYDGGAFLQKHVLAVDREEGTVSILRAWMIAGRSPAVSVDVAMPYEAFSGEIDDQTFSHADTRSAAALAQAFREHLSGEQVEIVWHNAADNSNASFVARTAKVNRAEQVVAGTVSVLDDFAVVEIGYRADLDALKPAQSRSPGL